MISFLGSRGKKATIAVACVCLAAALLASVQRDWALAAALVVLAALWVIVVGLWGVALTLHHQLLDLDHKLAQMRRELRPRGEAGGRAAKELHATLDKVAKDVERLALNVGPADADGFGSRSLERRYADVLTQPASVPNSELLAYLEILAKEATTRRADVAVIQDLLGEIRSLRAAEGQAVPQPS